MPRRSASASAIALPAPDSPGVFKRFLLALKTAFLWCFGIALIFGVVWTFSALEQFVITDARFRLEGPPEPGVENESFEIIGAIHASEQQITNLFARDFGRSIYLCPLAERRRRLLALDWVQDATVSRIWPNRIVVRIRERAPVAFVQIPAGDGTLTYGLVDADGVMLDPQRASRLALPVLAGLPIAAEHEAGRKERIKRFLRLQSEMGGVMAHISEIDVSDVSNIKVVQVMEGRAMTLMLGERKFLQRFQAFMDNYSEIRKRLPNATVLDLRLQDRITAVSDPETPVAQPPKKEVVKKK